VAAVVAVGATTAGCGSDAAHEMVGYRPSAEQVVGTMSLPDASNADAPFSFVAQPGHVLLAYFGYTTCPDVCPTTLSYVKKALKNLGTDRAARVDLAMTTIDPGRDSDEVISAYVQSFDPTAHGLRTADGAALGKVADAFGVSYSVTTAADGTIEVSHSGALYAVDDQGRVLLTWPFGVSAADIEGDLAALLQEQTT